jgi:hypothetical protein
MRNILMLLAVLSLFSCVNKDAGKKGSDLDMELAKQRIILVS